MSLQQFLCGTVVCGGGCGVDGAGAQGGEAARAVGSVGQVVVSAQCLTDCGKVIAHQCHIGTGSKCGLDAFARIGNTLCASHVEVVADNGAVKAVVT